MVHAPRPLHNWGLSARKVTYVKRVKAGKRQHREHEELKAAALVEAANYLARAEVEYDKVEFVCATPENSDFDALCYVWHENAARTLKIRIPDDTAETAPSKTTPTKVSIEVPVETEAPSDNADVPDFIRAA